MEELKPCPFCGYKNSNSPLMLMYREYDVPQREKGVNAIETWRYIVCLKCHCQTAVLRTEEEVVEVWNRRSE